MTAFWVWLNQISPVHLLAVIVLGILLALQIGPQEPELLGLFGLVGLAIPTGPTTGTTTVVTTPKA